LAAVNVLVYQIASKNCGHFFGAAKGFYGFISREAHDWLGSVPVAFLSEPKEFGRRHSIPRTFKQRHYRLTAKGWRGQFPGQVPQPPPVAHIGCEQVKVGKACGLPPTAASKSSSELFWDKNVFVSLAEMVHRVAHGLHPLCERHD
jgi:hypothetical protein